MNRVARLSSRTYARRGSQPAHEQLPNITATWSRAEKHDSYVTGIDFPGWNRTMEPSINGLKVVHPTLSHSKRRRDAPRNSLISCVSFGQYVDRTQVFAAGPCLQA